MTPAKAITSYCLPAPFHVIHMLILKQPDGEDDRASYYRDHLYMVDQNAEGGKVLLKVGPREACRKFLSFPALPAE